MRDTKITVKVSESERVLFKEAAHKAGLSMGAWARNAYLAAIAEGEPPTTIAGRAHRTQAIVAPVSDSELHAITSEADIHGMTKSKWARGILTDAANIQPAEGVGLVNPEIPAQVPCPTCGVDAHGIWEMGKQGYERQREAILHLALKVEELEERIANLETN